MTKRTGSARWDDAYYPFPGDSEELKGQTMVDIEGTPRRVEIVWWDAWSERGFYNVETIEHMPPALRKSIGYLIDENETTVTLTSDLIDISFTGERRLEGLTIIYKGMIERMTDL